MFLLNMGIVCANQPHYAGWLSQPSDLPRTKESLCMVWFEATFEARIAPKGHLALRSGCTCYSFF
jgi:hypothetical protein